MKVNFTVKYKVGQKLKLADRVYVVVGYEFVPARAMRYVLLHSSDGKALWEYVYDFEIDAMK